MVSLKSNLTRAARTAVFLAVAFLSGIGDAKAAPTTDHAPATLPATMTATNPTTAPDNPADAAIDGIPVGGAAADDAPELMLYKEMPVIVAAGKREQTQRQAAASVSVVSANDIQLFGYRSLADVLRGQRSFYLHTDGLNWFAGVRGFLRPGEWNARILTLVDGRPTHEFIYGQTHIDQDFIVPLEAVQRIEIVRGPGSALYGSNAVFAVINVVTKKGADVNGVEAKVEGGNEGTGRVNALYGTVTRDGWDILTDFSGYTSQGVHDIKYDGVHDADHNFGHIVNSDYEGVYSGFFQARKGEFTAQFDYESRQRDNRSATYLLSFSDPGAMHEDRANVTMRIDHPISEDQSLHAMVFWGHYGYRQNWLITDPSGTPGTYVTKADDSWLGEEIHYDWQITKKVHLLAGAEANQALYTHQWDSTTFDGSVLNVKPSFNSAGVFAEAEFKLTDWLSVTAGGRVDQVQRIGTNFSPRIAAIVTPNKQDTFKALYGRAFREPNLYEMFYSSPGANTPNPNLKPEINDTYELVWEHQYKSGWRTTLDGYYWLMSDAMDNVVQADGSMETENIGTIWARGIEGEVQKDLEFGGSFRAYGSLTQSQRDGHGLSHSPGWIVGTSLAIPVFNKRTFLAVEPQFVGPMKNDLGESTQPTFITNVVLTSRDVVKGLDLQVGLYNLFGNDARLPRDNEFNHFQHTLNYPLPVVLCSLTYRF